MLLRLQFGAGATAGRPWPGEVQLGPQLRVDLGGKGGRHGGARAGLGRGGGRTEQGEREPTTLTGPAVCAPLTAGASAADGKLSSTLCMNEQTNLC